MRGACLLPVPAPSPALRVRPAVRVLRIAQAAADATDVDEDEYMDFDPFLFIKNLPPLEQVRLMACPWGLD